MSHNPETPQKVLVSSFRQDIPGKNLKLVRLIIARLLLQVCLLWLLLLLSPMKLLRNCFSRYIWSQLAVARCGKCFLPGRPISPQKEVFSVDCGLGPSKEQVQTLLCSRRCRRSAEATIKYGRRCTRCHGLINQYQAWWSKRRTHTWTALN